MKKVLHISFFLLLTVLISACSKQSVRGHWTAEDKKAARMELEGIRSSIHSSVGSHTEVFIECYLKTLEQRYSNFNEASDDYEGRAKLAIECTAAVTP